MAKQQIENNKIKVDPPLWELEPAGKNKVETEQRRNNNQLPPIRKVCCKTSNQRAQWLIATSTNQDPQESQSQRSEIKNSEIWKSSGGIKKYRLITADSEGNYSKETKLTFVDQETKHEIVLRNELGKGAPTVSFVFPIDEQSFKTTSNH